MQSSYQIIGRIGGGGMGDVYKAIDPLTGSTVALKYMKAELVGDQLAAERFLREAQLLTEIRHEHVVRVLSVGTDPSGRPFFAMEFVDGESVQSLCRDRPLSESEAVRIALQALDALDAVHRRGVVHRDIKPSNLLMARDGRLVLIDFGIAYDAARSRITQFRHAIGTAMYMSPEQASGLEPTAQSDLYSLGIVLYEMLVGQPPFEAPSDLAVMRMVCDSPIPELPYGISPALQGFVHQATAKQPALRFRSAAVMKQKLASTVRIQGAAQGATHGENRAGLSFGAYGSYPAASQPPVIPNAKGGVLGWLAIGIGLVLGFVVLGWFLAPRGASPIPKDNSAIEASETVYTRLERNEPIPFATSRKEVYSSTRPKGSQWVETAGVPGLRRVQIESWVDKGTGKTMEREVGSQVVRKPVDETVHVSKGPKPTPPKNQNGSEILNYCPRCQLRINASSCRDCGWPGKDLR